MTTFPEVREALHDHVCRCEQELKTAIELYGSYPPDGLGRNVKAAERDHAQALKAQSDLNFLTVAYDAQAAEIERLRGALRAIADDEDEGPRGLIAIARAALEQTK